MIAGSRIPINESVRGTLRRLPVASPPRPPGLGSVPYGSMALPAVSHASAASHIRIKTCDVRNELSSPNRKTAERMSLFAIHAVYSFVRSFAAMNRARASLSELRGFGIGLRNCIAPMHASASPRIATSGQQPPTRGYSCCTDWRLPVDRMLTKC